MIYTVTLNPSLDYTAHVISADYGKTNRTKNESILPGGKGLNVSVMLKRLGVPSVALGFCAGFTGDELLRLAKSEGCDCDFIKLNSGFTRINMKLVSGEVTEYNGSGITVTDADVAKLCKKLAGLAENDLLVLSGSVPNGAEPTVYKTLLQCVPSGVVTVLDCSGAPLKNALCCRPFLVKPNIDELCDFFNTEIKTEAEIIKYAKKLQALGAENVLVSLGEGGAVLLTESGECFFEKVPDGEMQNTVGAGDSMVAGFIYSLKKTGDFRKALRFAVACGSATAYAPWLAQKSDIEKLCKSDKIK